MHLDLKEHHMIFRNTILMQKLKSFIVFIHGTVTIQLVR